MNPLPLCRSAISIPSTEMVQRLITLEAEVHYDEPTTNGADPFLVFENDSPVLVSAPHGARTFRNSAKETWHEEDEYTAGMARLLGETCGVSVIANVWRSDACDPNVHAEEKCRYKQRIRTLAATDRVRWVIDLHGASETSPNLGNSCVDLGTRKERRSMDVSHRDQLQTLIVAAFGAGSASADGFPALGVGTITAFCQESLHVQAIQIEMKPSVRVPDRRIDASSFRQLGAYRAPAENVGKMLGALADFIRYLTQVH